MGCGGSKGSVESNENGGPVKFVKEEGANLDPNKLKVAMELFKEWDIDGKGMIEIKPLKGVVVNVGPQEKGVLKQLTDMDFNGDGYVEEGEWEQYFSAVAGSLSDDEFKVIMDDLRESGGHMVTILRCKKMAGESTGPTAGVSPDDEGDYKESLEAEMKSMELPEKRAAMVKELFAIWDYRGGGQIAYKEINSAGVSVGPKEIKVLDDLKRMDINGDEFVDLPEMLTFFGAASSVMNDGEFETIIGEMTEIANATVGVAKMIALSQEQAVNGGYADEEEEIPVPPELSEKREELIKALFTAFSDSIDVPIPIKTLENEAKTTVGAAKESVMGNLIQMDANGDGMLEYGEMRDYFAVCGAALSDDEFSMVLGDMRDNAASAQLIKLAESMEKQ